MNRPFHSSIFGNSGKARSLCGAIVLCTASTSTVASADFTGWSSELVDLGNGHVVMNVYAEFSHPADRVLNLFITQISTNTSGGFFQSVDDPFWKPGVQNKLTSDDSWVTVGTNPNGNGNTTGAIIAGDPKFVNFDDANGSTDFSYIQGAGQGAGWYNNNPGNAWGFANVGGGKTPRVLVAHFVAASPYIGDKVAWDALMTIKNADGSVVFVGAGANEFLLVIPSDDDGDGVDDSIDNCIAVANPDQADCNKNGIGDACEIADGAEDYDQNGVLDSCECATNPNLPLCFDCNDNGIPDYDDIALGGMPDCNLDGVPDTCQGAVMVAEFSGNLGAPSGNDARMFPFTSLPPAGSEVQLVIDVVGDLNGLTEWIDISLNGNNPERFFEVGGSDCPTVPDQAIILMTAEAFNSIVGGTSALTVVMTCPGTVDATECKLDGSTHFSLSYVGINQDGDCNGNMQLDICETHDGSTPDCNANGVPDSCDIATGGAADCNGNGVLDSCEVADMPSLDCNGNGLIDSCEVAANPTLDCNGNGLIDSCEISGNAALDCNGNGVIDSCDVVSGASPDIDSNGVPDECQTVQVPGDFAGIQPAIDAAPMNEMRIIAVAPGTYAGPINFLGKPVVVRGSGAETTAISGSGGQTLAVVRFNGGEPAIASLEKFTIRDGLTGSPFPTNPTVLVGGGLFSYNSAANIRDCVFEDNVGGFGAGAYIWNSTGTVANCVFRDNAASGDGGGFMFYRGTPTVTDTLVENNWGNSRGGGVHFVEGVIVATRLVVRNNTSGNIVGGLSWAPGGMPNTSLTLVDSEVTGNHAFVSQGGIGIGPTGPVPTMTISGTTVCSNVPLPNITGPWSDLGGNSVCECVGDLTLDGVVNGGDLGILLSQWGPAQGNTSGDLDNDGSVNGADLGMLLSAWGVCPK